MSLLFELHINAAASGVGNNAVFRGGNTDHHAGRWISMPPEGDNVDEVKEQLRRDLLPCFDAAILTNAVSSVLSSVGNKGLKRDEVARKIGSIVA
jgi:hypothetical protein